jgi:DNA primase
MALPQSFLDELRARLTLSTVIGRRVKLIRAGREFKACCPFHTEKTPSFTVNDDKGFFHCFGCGAHGDVITFEMQAANLTFPEAVEKLAGEAGLEVPRASREEVEQARRRADVLEVVEAACAFFEQQLRMPVGKPGLAYLHRRGLDDATIGRFRLGYAPPAGALKAAMARSGIDEEQLVEAGLLKRRDDGTVHDYFRDRVMFPITDRRGRPIAFGGRLLGDGQPKYLNSPDTPHFHKGTVLYGLAQAREAAGRSGRIIVAEGYMDVIALSRSGFPQSVAPLGTALTEQQIETLWRLADEPILCFDADAAGQRAAARAAERALALLRPGKSLRFAVMKSPAGGTAKDPDDLLREDGVGAMRRVLDSARPLLDVLWSNAVEGRPLDTPERRAALERDVHGLVGRIADRSVQGHYRQAVKERLFDLFRRRRPPAAGGRSGESARRSRVAPGQSWAAPAWSAPLTPVAAPESIDVLQKRILLTTLITHPEMADHVGERLGALDFAEDPMDRLREGVLMILAREPSLDFVALTDHLRADGCGGLLDSLLRSNVYTHAAFARPEADTETARRGWDHTFDLLIRRKDLKADRDLMVERLGENPTEKDFQTFLALNRHMLPPDTD